MKIWRRWLCGIVVATVGLLGFGGSALAASAPEVTGNVTNNGIASSSASVSVTCTSSDNGQHVRNTTASSTGHYNISFGVGQCNDGSNITVVATSSDGTMSGQASGTMGSAGISQRVNVDVSIAPTAALPEFGIVTAGVALVAVAVLFYLVRRQAFAYQRAKVRPKRFR